nr:integrase, catalytic region, zinc finger, CCHC-type, peptidase aspartic, catalytic [Tanacetum cinerariifolium]
MESTYFSLLMKVHSRWDGAEMRLLQVYQANQRHETYQDDMPKIQLNSKLVNNMLPEWGRFMMAFKLNKDLKESNHDQLYAYLKQHELHANKNKMLMERINQYSHDPLALNEDNIFQADQCDAFDSNVDEAPTAQTMFMANLSSTDPVYDEAGPSYDSNTLSEVQYHDNCLDNMNESHKEHEMHNDV